VYSKNYFFFQNKEREQLQTKVAELEPLRAQVNNLKQNTNIVKESNIKINELNEELSKYAFLFFF
jgi:hypothetical protein